MPSGASRGSEFDVFISHASEDKEEVARPLSELLTARRLRVWLNEQELMLGDTLGRKIDEGLARSRFGVVILSPYFFAKHWPRQELDGLVARETVDGVKVILPVWHNTTQVQVTAESPTLGARLAAETSQGIDRVADAIEKVVRAKAKQATTQVIQAPLPPEGEDLAISEPASAHDEVLDLIRRGDKIRSDEVRRGERSRFQTSVDSVTAEYVNRHLDEEAVRDRGSRLVRAAERRTASLIPLALYSPDGLRQELRAHAGWMSRTELRGGGMTWQQAWRFPWWIISMTLGGLLCRLERFQPVAELLQARWVNYRGKPEGFVGYPREVGDAVARLEGPEPPPEKKWRFAPWPWLNQEVAGWAWLIQRYPDWLAHLDEPGNAFAEFAMLDEWAESFRGGGGEMPGLWSLESNAARQFARRLYSDASVRAEVAQAVGVDLNTFDEQAPSKLAEAHGSEVFRSGRKWPGSSRPVRTRTLEARWAELLTRPADAPRARAARARRALIRSDSVKSTRREIPANRMNRLKP